MISHHRDRIIELTALCQKARDAYYQKAQPFLADAEYDAYEKELRDEVAKFPEFAELAASVLQNVGSDLTAGGRVKHNFPMLSIENQYTFEDVIAWAASLPPNTKIVLEPKFDGISVSLIYKEGKLIRALSRGTGTEGEDMTAQVRAVKSIPKSLDIQIDMEVRGELVMQNKTLAAINALGGKQYSSTRNLTAGTMKQSDLNIVASRDIMLMPWDVISMDAGMPDSGLERLRFIADYGFYTAFGNQIYSDDIDSITATLEMKLRDRETIMRKSLSLETDGVVIKVDSNKLRKQLGVASKYTNWQVCFKPQSASGTTYLREIQWQVGRTGVISPVAKCDVVVLAGANVTSASLNNITFIRKMGLKLGAKVEMLRSGDVIPQIVRVIDDGDTEIEIPLECPECHGPVAQQDEGGKGIVQAFCKNAVLPNFTCVGAVAGYLAFVGSRDVLEVDSLGPEMARRLVEGGYARDLAELYEFAADMKKERERMTASRFVDLARLKGFDANLPKMLDSLEKAKTAPWERWIKALGIPMIGDTLGKVIAAKLDLKADGMSLLVSTGLIPFTQMEIDGFGEAKMAAIHDWCTAANNDLVLSLFKSGVRPTPVEKVVVAEGAPLKGVIFCITGEFGEDRDTLTKKLVALGAEAKSGVTKKINLLIVGNAAGKTKLTKAKELGIKQVGTEWLEEALGGKLKEDTFAAEQA